MAAGSSPDPERERLRLEIERLQAENDKFRQEREAGEKPKTWRRMLLETWVGGSVASAVIGALIAIAPPWFDDVDQRCAPAHAAILDDRLNPSLSMEQQKAYMDTQFRIAQECDRPDE